MLRRRGCRLRVMTRVDEQACALGEELVVELGVGGEDQGEVRVLERSPYGAALGWWTFDPGPHCPMRIAGLPTLWIAGSATVGRARSSCVRERMSCAPRRSRAMYRG